jgi:sterol desaturase/sphingolipid hydroxylase (fatty acid hydroxylase superfamily)
MKTSIAKMLFIIPVLFFLDWIIMIVFGCTSCFFGAGIVYYYTVYYYFGIALLVLTTLFLGYIFLSPYLHRRIHF